MKNYLLSFLLLPLNQAAANASGVVLHAEPIGSGLGGMVLSLFGLLAVIGGLYWFARRILHQRFGISRRAQSMRLVSITMLGPKEKIVVVDTREGDILVLGVTAHQITLLDKRPAEQREI